MIIHMKKKSIQDALMLLFKLAVSLFLLRLIFKSIEFSAIKEALQHPVQPVYIFASAFLLLPNLLLQWLRWHYLLKLLVPDTSPSESVSSLFGGLVMGFVTPGRVGEAGRTLFISSANRIQVIGLLLIDKLYVLILIGMGGVWGLGAMLLYKHDYSAFITAPILFILVLFFILGLGLAFQPNWFRTAIYSFSLILPRRDKIKLVLSCFDYFGKEQGRKLFLLTAVHYVIYIAQFSFLAFAFESIPLTTALTSVTCVMLAKTLLPFSFADIGIREAASVYFHAIQCR